MVSNFLGSWVSSLSVPVQIKIAGHQGSIPSVSLLLLSSVKSSTRRHPKSLGRSEGAPGGPVREEGPMARVCRNLDLPFVHGTVPLVSVVHRTLTPHRKSRDGLGDPSRVCVFLRPGPDWSGRSSRRPTPGPTVTLGV